MTAALQKLLSTKFLATVTGVVGLIGAALLGQFTGELGLSVSGIVGAYITGNTLITRSAISNGTSGG